MTTCVVRVYTEDGQIVVACACGLVVARFPDGTDETVMHDAAATHRATS